MSIRLWELKPQAPPEFFTQFPEYPPVVLQLLWGRGLQTQEAIDEFFNPDYEQDLHDPFLLKDMEKAVGRIKKALLQKERIAVFGDYDADGVCGAAIVHTIIRDLGGMIDIYIPHRELEGYGLTNDAITELREMGTNLLITVDCGITDHKEIARAEKEGMDVIVLDHHIVVDKPPEANAVIDAKRSDDSYPFKWLSGAGAAFKFVQALLVEGIPEDVGHPLLKGYEKWFLDLVAIAAVADRVPLLGENRTLVRYGIEVLEKRQRPGIAALTSGNSSSIDMRELNFGIIPKINAASRMDHANVAFRLLTTRDHIEAQTLAQHLEAKNQERRNLVVDILESIEREIAAMPSLPYVLVFGDSSWLVGVAGIVAGKLAERYHRPSFVFSRGELVSRGSARGIEGFNVVDAMAACGEHFFEEFGGHAQAGGFTVSAEKLADFRERIEAYGRDHLTPELLQRSLSIDARLTPQEIGWDLAQWLERFEPFGAGNPEPIFLLEDLEIESMRAVGQDGRHLQLELLARGGGGRGKIFPAIAFNHQERLAALRLGDRIDAVCACIADHWNGTRTLKLKIHDVRPAQTEFKDQNANIKITYQNQKSHEASS